MTPEDDDLDAGLRALFADQRLNVPAGEAAVHAVVAGAKRRRRRRTAVLATGGALGVAVVLLAGGLFAGHVLPPKENQAANPPGLSTARPTPDQTGPRPAPQPSVMPPNSPTVLGPTGYGAIAIGMAAKQVLGTGLVNTPVSGSAGCTGYTYRAAEQSRTSAAAVAPVQGKSLFVYLNTREPSVVQAIVAPTGVSTPEGIGVGSPVASIRATYQDPGPQQGNVLPVPVPGRLGLSYWFTIDNDTVTSVALALTDATCQP